MDKKLQGPTRGPSLSEKAKQGLRSMHAAQTPFRDLRADMPLQYVTAFLLVAIDEGQNVTTYAERAGVTKSVMSRHLHDIGDADRMNKEGYGLVEHRPHPEELRSVTIWLTPKGRALAYKIQQAWELGHWHGEK